MAYEIDNININTRIRDALDWARTEEGRHYAKSKDPELDAPTRLAASTRGVAFEATRVVLEEILTPGKHSGNSGG